MYLVGRKIHFGFPLRSDWKIPNEVFGQTSISVITQSMVVHMCGWLEDFHNDVDDLSLRKEKGEKPSVKRSLCQLTHIRVRSPSVHL